MASGASRRAVLVMVLGQGAQVIVALVANYLPAQRASLVDPVVALRYE